MATILILSNSVGGLCSFRYELFDRLVKLGHEVWFAVPQDEEHRKVRLLRELGAKYIHTEFARRAVEPFGERRLIRRYIDIIGELNPDVILTYTIKPNIYGTYAAHKKSTPVIMNVTGLGSLFHTSRFQWLGKALYRYACSKARYVFFQNQSNLDFFVGNRLVSLDKAYLIPGSGVNTEKFAPMAKTTTDNTIRFLFIGRLMKEKGIEEYLVVANRITEKYDDVEFCILGGFEEDVYRDVVKYNTNPRIKYLGISDDVRNEIREADCIVHPSYHEGMSNALLEGGAMGKPLLASNIPGCMEIVEDGVNGFLFEPRSIESLTWAITRFLELGKGEREAMGRKSRSKIEKEFSRDLVVDAYISAINDILERECY